jgi:hypothetical protein
MQDQKVQDHPELIRDAGSGAVVNVDNRSLDAYKKQKRERNMVANAFQDINNLKEGMVEIRGMLTDMIEAQRASA